MKKNKLSISKNNQPDKIIFGKEEIMYIDIPNNSIYVYNKKLNTGEEEKVIEAFKEMFNVVKE